MNFTKNLQIEERKLLHPFADKPTPLEDFRQTVILAIETIFQFFIRDIIGNAGKLIGSGVAYVFILFPLAVLGLVFEYLRKCKSKVREIQI